jgi:hypothetical protein
MTHDSHRVIPFSFDLSSLVRRSVASLYSHLVTRPTGRALRHGIESQIGESSHLCLSVLDFTQVVVLDYSCADEAVAKLIQRYQAEERPADAYFVARGLAEQHREPLDEVLLRHGLTLVAEDDGQFVLLGAFSELEALVWQAVQRRGVASSGQVHSEVSADYADVAEADVAGALATLTHRRVLFHRSPPPAWVSLTTLLPEPAS